MWFPLVALVTIGQSPRDDMAAPILACLPADASIRQYGLLDGLSADQIAERFDPALGGMPLVTLLADGREVLISSKAAEHALRDLLERLDDSATDVVVMLCTGVFEGIACHRARLVQPDQLVPEKVAGHAGTRRVGIIVPTAAQLDDDAAKWGLLASTPLLAAASPYARDSMDEIRAAARKLRAQGAELIVLDCMGYGDAHRDAAADACGLEVIASSAVVAESLRAPD